MNIRAYIKELLKEYRNKEQNKVEINNFIIVEENNGTA
jgi:hypothetical protein